MKSLRYITILVVTTLLLANGLEEKGEMDPQLVSRLEDLTIQLSGLQSETARLLGEVQQQVGAKGTSGEGRRIVQRPIGLQRHRPVESLRRRWEELEVSYRPGTIGIAGEAEMPQLEHYPRPGEEEGRRKEGGVLHTLKEKGKEMVAKVKEKVMGAAEESGHILEGRMEQGKHLAESVTEKAEEAGAKVKEKVMGAVEGTEHLLEEAKEKAEAVKERGEHLLQRTGESLRASRRALGERATTLKEGAEGWGRYLRNALEWLVGAASHAQTPSPMAAKADERKAVAAALSSLLPPREEGPALTRTREALLHHAGLPFPAAGLEGALEQKAPWVLGKEGAQLGPHEETLEVFIKHQYGP